jgi:hypothetical protein
MMANLYVRGREQSVLALRAKRTRRDVFRPLVRINVEGKLDTLPLNFGDSVVQI